MKCNLFIKLPILLLMTLSMALPAQASTIPDLDYDAVFADIVDSTDEFLSSRPRAQKAMLQTQLAFYKVLQADLAAFIWGNEFANKQFEGDPNTVNTAKVASGFVVLTFNAALTYKISKHLMVYPTLDALTAVNSAFARKPVPVDKSILAKDATDLTPAEQARINQLIKNERKLISQEIKELQEAMGKFTAIDRQHLIQKRMDDFINNLSINRDSHSLAKSFSLKIKSALKFIGSLPAKLTIGGAKVIAGAGMIGTGIILDAGIIYYTWQGLQVLYMTEEQHSKLFSEVEIAIDLIQEEINALN